VVTEEVAEPDRDERAISSEIRLERGKPRTVAGVEHWFCSARQHEECGHRLDVAGRVRRTHPPEVATHRVSGVDGLP
jgi:hypothetical protein